MRDWRIRRRSIIISEFFRKSPSGRKADGAINTSTSSRILLSAAALLAAMGATGGIRPAASRTPNYVSRLEHRVAWPEFPLKVAFVKDAELSASRDAEAVAGFRQWEAATDGLVRFIVVDDPSRAQVLVSFNPLSNDGATTNSFARGEMIRAEMKIGVKGDRGADIACVAAHEFGHALGITGHSEDRKDLMYPYHWMGKGCGISERDLNTLSDRYPALAARLVNEKAAALASR